MSFILHRPFRAIISFILHRPFRGRHQIFSVKYQIFSVMEQKIVIKVQLHCRRCRSKAMKMAAMASGVNSVALAGEEKDQIVVVGEKVDAAGLTDLLRKKVGYATLELVQGVSVKA